MAALAGPLAIAGGIVGAIGSFQQGMAEARAAEYNQQIAERNRVIADQNRKQAIATANIEAEDRRRENRRVLSSIVNAYGGSGLTLEGSPLDVIEDTATEQALDVRRIEYEGRARAREATIQMRESEEEAALYGMRKRSSRAMAFLGGFGQLIRGGSGYVNATA